MAADNHSVEIMDIANHLHPVAQVFSIPSSVSVVEGVSTLEHLNRIVSIDTLKMPMLGRIDGLLCNANGRILDITTVCNLNGRAIILGSMGRGKEIRQNIASGIPWNEELVVKDADEAISHLLLIGKAPQRCLVGLGIDSSELSNEKWLEFGNSLLSIHWSCPEAIQILVPASHHDSLIAALEENGAKFSDLEQWGVVRILSSILDHHEMNPNNLPFELGLQNLVALDKGCYPGQEIHARMESRGGIARSLVRLKSSELVPIGKSKIENIGRVMVTDAYRYGDGGIALALIPHAASGIDSIQFENGIIAEVESIRF